MLVIVVTNKLKYTTLYIKIMDMAGEYPVLLHGVTCCYMDILIGHCSV